MLQSWCRQGCLQNLELETQHLARDIFSTEQSLYLFLCEKEQTEFGNSSLKLMAFFFSKTQMQARRWKFCSKSSHSAHIILWIKSNQNLSCIIIFSNINSMGLLKLKCWKHSSIFHADSLFLCFIQYKDKSFLFPAPTSSTKDTKCQLLRDILQTPKLFCLHWKLMKNTTSTRRGNYKQAHTIPKYAI